MKIRRSGHRRSKGTSRLVDQDILTIDRKSEAPHWDKDNAVLSFQVTGRDGKSTYDYRIEIRVEELALLLDVAVSESTDNATARAAGKAIACFLKEIVTASSVMSKKNP